MLESSSGLTNNAASLARYSVSSGIHAAIFGKKTGKSMNGIDIWSFSEIVHVLAH